MSPRNIQNLRIVIAKPSSGSHTFSPTLLPQTEMIGVIKKGRGRPRRPQKGKPSINSLLSKDPRGGAERGQGKKSKAYLRKWG
jgi:hypothetical protein